MKAHRGVCVCPLFLSTLSSLGSWSAQLVGEAPWVWPCFGAAAALSLQLGSGFKHRASWELLSASQRPSPATRTVCPASAGLFPLK